MGYVRQKLHTLWFEGEEFEGLEVSCRSVSIGTWLHVVELTDGGIKPSEIEKFKEVVEIVGETLTSWNLETDDGNAVGCDLEHLLEQDRWFVEAVVNSWINSMAGLKNPLESNVAQMVLPMEPLSATG